MRHVSGARRGLDMWLLQRASAIYMVLFSLVFLVWVASLPTLDYLTWRALFAPLGMKIAFFMFIAALLVHAWIGLREIAIDYVRCAGCTVLRLSLNFVIAVLYLACLVWTADILWSLS